jgi:hypothetical protein
VDLLRICLLGHHKEQSGSRGHVVRVRGKLRVRQLPLQLAQSPAVNDDLRGVLLQGMGQQL